MIKFLMNGLSSCIWFLSLKAATGFYLFAYPSIFLWNAAQKKSKQKRLVPLNRSAYWNGHAFTYYLKVWYLDHVLANI